MPQLLQQTLAGQWLSSVECAILEEPDPILLSSLGLKALGQRQSAREAVCARR